ncbi:hypothetical protein DUNSADRAFT_8809 [Dunaliella salina]|uniref:ABC transporter domain-containing protein n=1 Tax=Dunaliella salina TaxID=3046 RepID=A0ABQ7GIN6_DUNSA|nr:hypothetical protein DUNSADRAFT_8809 [Dunaliella salina]|eukprot:KAF5834484.1 hypothetical protein DUNSADRAFT_8809 [Dunaliella salina]
MGTGAAAGDAQEVVLPLTDSKLTEGLVAHEEAESQAEPSASFPAAAAAASLSNGSSVMEVGGPVVLSWQHVHVTVTRSTGEQRQILRDVSGVAGPGTHTHTHTHTHPEATPGATPSNLKQQRRHAAHAGEATDNSALQLGGGDNVGQDVEGVNESFSAASPSQGGGAVDWGVNGGMQGGTEGNGYGHAGGGSSGSVSKGSLFAILGPSGAGKTTLLDVLGGRRHGEGVQGEDDVLPGTLTVSEYLAFQASLKLPPAKKNRKGDGERPAHSDKVWSVIKQLGLTRVAHSFIGDSFMRGLSGGEKRRVSIAIELLSAPGLLLLDEPTTGLDSTNAARVVDILARLAREGGITVILSIHQPRPDIFRLMDRAMLLSGNGEVVYSGPASDACNHLGVASESAAALVGPPQQQQQLPGQLLTCSPDTSPADFMLDLVIRSKRELVVALVDAFRDSEIAQNDDTWACSLADSPGALPPAKYKPSFITQLGALSTRLLRNTYRHPFLVLLNFVASLCAAIAVGLIFRNAGTDTGGIQNRLGVLFFMLLYLSLMSLSSLPVWRQEKLLYLRERDSGSYGSAAYYIAVVVFDLLPLRVLPPFFFALFAYWVVGLHPSCASCLLWFIGVLVGTNIASASMCMAIGAATPSNSVANMLASLIMMLLLLFGGFLLNKQRVPVYCRWIAKLSFFNYAYEALAVNEFHGFPVDFYFTSPIKTSVLPPLRITGDGVLNEFGFNEFGFEEDIVMLCVLCVMWGILTYTLLALAGTTAAEQASKRLKAFLHGLGVCVRAMFVSTPPDTGYQPLTDAPPTEDSGSSPANNHGRVPYWRNTGVATDAHKGMEADGRVAEHSSDVHTAVEIKAPQEQPLGGAQEGRDEIQEGIRANGGGSNAGSMEAKASGQTDQSLLLPLPPQHPQPRGRVLNQGLGDGACTVLSWENLTCKVALPQGGARYVLQAVTGCAGPIPSSPPPHPFAQPTSQVHAAALEHSPQGTHTAAEGRQPSCLMAVLGPSGAGKTTLLDILAGRKPYGVQGGLLTQFGRQASSSSTASGEVRINGRLVDSRTLCHLVGYVQQEVVLPGTSTVWEYLTFHASLRLPAHTPSEEVQERVAAVAEQLGLTKVAHNFIGDAFVRGLSGGEKRRVSIAVELLCAPGLLLLDEPTTGLDSTNAARVVDIMAGLARDGVTVLMSIHQPRPDIFRLMDRLLLLSSEGQVVFTGPTSAAQDHFGSLGLVPPTLGTSVADHVLDLVIKARPKYHASYLQQVAALSRRLSANCMRHPLLIGLNFGATFVMALGLGAIYWRSGRDTGGIHDRFGSLFFMLMYLALASLSSLPIWCDDRLLFVRERAAGAYGTASYFTSVVLFDVLPMRLLPPLFFVAISYPMIGLRAGGLYWAHTLLVLVLSNITAASLSMAIGAALPSVALANMAGSLAVLLSMLFGGFLLSRNKMPGWIGWAAGLSYVRYAFEALVSTEFHGATGFRFTAFHQPGAPPDKLPHVNVSGDDILATFGFSTADSAYWHNVAALTMLCGLLLGATFLLLKYRVGRV